MSVQGWKYYNHAMIPDGRPDQEPDLTPVENGEIWSNVHGGGDTATRSMDNRLGLWV